MSRGDAAGRGELHRAGAVGVGHVLGWLPRGAFFCALFNFVFCVLADVRARVRAGPPGRPAELLRAWWGGAEGPRWGGGLRGWEEGGTARAAAQFGLVSESLLTLDLWHAARDGRRSPGAYV